MDIVERLRQRKERIIAANSNGIISMADNDALEAADEIERLREALNLIRVAIQNYGNGGKSEGFALGYVDEVARAALKGDE